MPERDSWAVGATADRKVGTEDARLGTGALWTPGDTPIGVRSGIRLSFGDPGRVLATGTPGPNVTVNAFQAALHLAARPGAYTATLDATKTIDVLTANPADPTNIRHDLIVAQQNDADYGDTNRDFQVIRITGTASGSPVDPAVPGSPNYVTLARIRVAAATSTITNAMIDDLRPPWIVAAGGILPVRTKAERDAITPWGGIHILRFDRAPWWIETYDTAWRVVGTAICASVADRDGANGINNPYNGQQAVTTDTGTEWLRHNGVWVDARTVGLAAELTAVKATDKTVTSSTTLSNDTELVIPLVANAKYAFEAYLIYSSASAADAKFALTGPASATAQISGYGIPTGETSVFGTMNISVLPFGSDWQIGAAGVGTKRTCITHASIVVAGTAGNLTVQFAQVTSDAGNTVLHIGSWIRVKRIG